MSRLTVTEKDHWKSRIERRINKAIEVLELKDPNLIASIDAEAEKAAHKQIGTHNLQAELQHLKDQIRSLEEARDRVQTEMLKVGLGESYSTQMPDYHNRNTFAAKLKRVQETLADGLLRNTDIGREILKLRVEKESLLDTVWLATSNSQIRDLWTRVASVVGDETTPLQQEVLNAQSSDIV